MWVSGRITFQQAEGSETGMAPFYFGTAQRKVWLECMSEVEGTVEENRGPDKVGSCKPSR